MWATSACPHLRPYMAPLYRDLRSAAGALKLIHPRMWQTFLNALDNSARVALQPPGLWLPFKAQVIRAGSHEIRCKADLPKVISAQKGTWVRVADPQRAELHLRPESRGALQWLFTCFAHDRRRVLRQKPLLHCFAAADARADGDLIGIGGWIVTANRCAWFAEHWHAAEIRAVWPQLAEAPQRYIACFETLAQLALAMTARRSLGAQQWTFCLPAASDNTAAEAQTEKLWSTAEPLGSFLKLTAAWAARHHIELLVTHLAGERNAWASQHRTAPVFGCIRVCDPAPAQRCMGGTSLGSATALSQRALRKGQPSIALHIVLLRCIIPCECTDLQVHRTLVTRGAWFPQRCSNLKWGSLCIAQHFDVRAKYLAYSSNPVEKR